jgi:hypothetical protein
VSDNTTLPGTGEEVRTIDKSGKKTQVVTLDLGGGGAESLISGSIPVTGSFWQTTQPVSGTFWQATQPVSGTVSVSGSVAVTGSFYQATQPVSGTFWQATQPVSGSVSVSNFPSSQAVTGTFYQATQPVSGTFWQATQPVSIASMPSTPVTGTFWQATQPVSGTVAATQSGTWNIGSITTLPALAAGTANIGDVDVLTLPALTTGSNVIGKTTDTSQIARVLFTANFNSAAAAAADTLLTTLVVNRAGVATTGQTSIAVTSGKTMRLTSVVVSLRTTTAVLPYGVLTLRMNPSGAAVIGSPVVSQFPVSGSAAVIGNTGSLSFDLGDEGMEFSGTQQIGLSFSNNVATNVTAVSVIGYEYTTPA